MKIKYVGVKQDGETAFKSETGITWLPGSSEDVPVALAVKMLKHPDVFAEDTAEAAAPAAPVTLQPLGKTVISLQSTLAPGAVAGEAAPSTDPLDAMTREELHALAKERGIKVHHSSGAAAVKAAILAADAPTAG